MTMMVMVMVVTFQEPDLRNLTIIPSLPWTFPSSYHQHCFQFVRWGLQHPKLEGLSFQSLKDLLKLWGSNCPSWLGYVTHMSRCSQSAWSSFQCPSASSTWAIGRPLNPIRLFKVGSDEIAARRDATFSALWVKISSKLDFDYYDHAAHRDATFSALCQNDS